MIGDIESIGAPVVIVDVENENQFTFNAANQMAYSYYRTTKELAIGRNYEDTRGLTSSQKRGAKRSLALYRRCVQQRSTISTTTRSDFDDATHRWARHTIAPAFVGDEIKQLIITSIEISALKISQHDLSNALARVLSGFVTVCAWCKNIKNNEEQWQPIEEYAASQMDYHQFSHGICPSCALEQSDQVDAR